LKSERKFRCKCCNTEITELQFRNYGNCMNCQMQYIQKIRRMIRKFYKLMGEYGCESPEFASFSTFSKFTFEIHTEPTYRRVIAWRRKHPYGAYVAKIRTTGTGRLRINLNEELLQNMHDLNELTDELKMAFEVAEKEALMSDLGRLIKRIIKKGGERDDEAQRG